jgi:hypothetical protein
MKSRQSLKTIRFEDELLPDWAQLLEVAASVSAVPESTCRWFCRFAARTGVDDARTIIEHCSVLRSALLTRRESVLVAIAPGTGDSAPETIHKAWIYALDTMVEKATGAQTCQWHVDGAEDSPDQEGGGDITLRRV